MIRSMTGFGKAVCELNGKTINIEIKSLNSKQLDLYTRIPGLYREKDMDIRNLLSQRLNRGKIEFNLTYESSDNNVTSQINQPVVKAYFNQLLSVAGELGIQERDHFLQIVMRMPEALKGAREEFNENEWTLIEVKIGEALDEIDRFREKEGHALKDDITERISIIIKLLSEIDPYEEDRITKIRERLKSSMIDLMDLEKIDANRMEQEIIYYLEKLDITEEKVRLLNHCNFFEEVIDKEAYSGKKLGFIAQEMGREINTIGSKANHAGIQKIVVLMKDELEKIKEQLMNVL